MRVFLTGATGFVGSHILPELLASGHSVLGLTRSEAGARQLSAAGAETHRGAIEDLESLRAGTEQADAVIHTAFDHDFSRYVDNCEKDRQAIAAIGAALQGSDRPFLVTSATMMGDRGDGGRALESVFNADVAIPRVASEVAANALLDAGVDVRVIRLPQVHDPVKQGLVTPYVQHAREAGIVAYLGEGTNGWSAGHVSDVARLYTLALDCGEAGGRYHAASEESVAFRDIAAAVAQGLKLPLVSMLAEEAQAHFGWLAMFVGRNGAAASEWTRAQLGWQPTGPGLVADLQAMDYTPASTGA